MGRQDALDAADAIAIFDFGVDGLFVPIASGSLQGAGIHDPDEAVSRLATPLDFERFRSLPQPGSWDRFGDTLNQILIELRDQGGMDEVIAWAESIGLIARTGSDHFEVVFGLNLAIEYPDDFGTGAGMAYSRYIESQAQSYVDLVVKVLPGMFNAYVCANWVRLDANGLLLLVAEHMVGQSNSRLDMTIEAMEQWIAGHPTLPAVPGAPKLDCNGLLEALKGLRTAVEVFVEARDWVSSRLEDPAKAWDDFGYVALFLAELLRSRSLAKAIADAVGANESEQVKAERIGAIYGTLIGMIMWEVIEEVFTAGIGKGARIIRLVR